eukprot:Hpha_TRINITY_DN25920_c0_g1::TRINITY_DN25920_c0_g1_i1::g.185444::m.185444
MNRNLFVRSGRRLHLGKQKTGLQESQNLGMTSTWAIALCAALETPEADGSASISFHCPAMRFAAARNVCARTTSATAEIVAALLSWRSAERCRDCTAERIRELKAPRSSETSAAVPL